MLSPWPIILWARLASGAMPWYADGPGPETPSEYRARVAVVVAGARAAVADVYGWADERTQLGWTAAILAKWDAESGRFRLEVHSGEVTGDGGRARCLGQLHPSRLVPRDEWLATTGTGRAATTRCARATLRYLRGAVGTCGGGLTVEGLSRAYALYGTGSSCEPTEWSRRRALRWAGLVERAGRVVR